MDKVKKAYLDAAKKYEGLNTFLEVVILAFLFLYEYAYAVQTTAFTAGFGSILMGFASQTVLWFVIFRLFFLFQNGREVILPIAVCVLLYVFYQFRPTSLLYVLGIALIGTVGMDYHKILKAHVAVIGLTVFSAILASLTGTIDNLVYLWDGNQRRDSFGICYPTDFASFLFYLFLFFWIAWDRIPHWISLILCVPFMIVVRGYALSDTCFLCGIAFILVLLLLTLVEKKVTESGIITWVKKVFDFLLVGAFPLLACLMFAMIGLYANEQASGIAGLGGKLNDFLTGRLGLALNSIREHGITLLGSDLKQQGNGFTTFPVMGYDFVDSTYPLVLLRNGWIMLLVMGFLWVRMSFVAVREKKYRLAFGMALIALHSFVEHHFTEMHYNVLLYVAFASITQAGKRVNADGEEKKEAKWKKYLDVEGKKLGICIATLILAWVLTAPLWLAGLRTICGSMRRAGDERESLFVVGAFLGMVLANLILAYGAALAWSRKKNENGKDTYVLPLAVGAVLSIGLLTCGVIMTAQAGEKVRTTVQEDLSVLKEIDKAALGKIYSTEFPTEYGKSLKKLKYGILTGEDLARKKNVTVIVPREKEYYVFFRKDFSYTAISEKSAVYSNDPEVLNKLSAMGFTPKKYYDEIRYVELPIHMAPLTNLRKGLYTVIYRFRVQPGDKEPENVAEITIVGNKGHDILFKEGVPASKMDENGDVEYELKLELKSDVPGIMFYLLDADGCMNEVKEVQYQMTP